MLLEEYEILSRLPEHMEDTKLRYVIVELTKRCLDKEVLLHSQHILNIRLVAHFQCYRPIRSIEKCMDISYIQTIKDMNDSIYMLREYLYQLQLAIQDLKKKD